MWLRERPRWQTLVAIAVAFCGIVIIVGGAGGRSDVIGIALACFMMAVIAAMTVVVRRHKGTPMVAAAALSNFLGSVVSVPFADGIASVTSAQLLTLAMFGVFQVGLGLSLFMLGSRYLPSGQAALIGTIETPLMPFWIWLAFQEIPTARALTGGAIVMAAVVADIAGEIRSQQRTG
jgi:drug/metabolite transporter (DMT)-like permease